MNTYSSRQTVAQQYQIKISQTLALADAALDVSGCEGIHIEPKHVTALRNEMEPLRTLLKGAHQDEFKIAVVGMENAGKTTFINAWLGFDMLPTDYKRSTYAPTQIRSAKDGHQHMAVEVFTQAEFDDRKRKLFERAKVDNAEGRKAKTELEFITNRLEQLRSVIDAGHQEIEFREFNEVKDALRKYVSDPAVALAVREVKLYTNHLDDVESIVLYDIPSLNTGLGMDDITERRIVRNCDLVVVVQDAKSPTITPTEKLLVKHLQSGDADRSISERMFVFLNGADRCESQDLCFKNAELARREWKRVAGLPEEHVLIGSSLLGLFAGGSFMQEQTRRAHGEEAGLQEKAETLIEYLHQDPAAITTKDFAETLDAIASVSAFREQINTFLKEEQFNLFQAKVDAAVFEVRRLAQIVYEAGAEAYSDNVEVARRKVQDTWRIDFARWRCDYVRDEIELALDETFDKLPSVAKGESALYEEYQALIDKYLDLNTREDAIKGRVFSRRASSFSHPESANAAWRRELSTEIKSALDTLSQQLADSMYSQLSQLLDTMESKLWHDPKVAEILIGSPEVYRARLHAGLDALLQRYAGPLIEATVAAPRDTKLRQDVKNKLRNDLMALAEYTEQAYEDDGYAIAETGTGSQVIEFGEMSGGTLASRPAKPDDLLAFIDSPGFAKALSSGPHGTVEDPTLWLTEVEREVKEDVAFMESHLRREIFFASGITDFWQQEFRRLRDDFSSREAYWEGIIDNAFERQDKDLMKALPDHLKADEQFAVISAAIANLKQALQQDSMA